MREGRAFCFVFVFGSAGFFFWVDASPGTRTRACVRAVLALMLIFVLSSLVFSG